MSMSKDKFCVVPGSPEVRIASTSGHIVVIGETPRHIPAEFILEAKGKGCLTEAEMENLKARFLGSAQSTDESGQVDEVDDTADEPAAADLVEPVADDPDRSRFEAIKEAVIVLFNNGDPSQCEKDGKPKVAALSEACGFKVTGAERDAAFDAVTK